MSQVIGAIAPGSGYGGTNKTVRLTRIARLRPPYNGGMPRVAFLRQVDLTNFSLVGMRFIIPEYPPVVQESAHPARNDRAMQ